MSRPTKTHSKVSRPRPRVLQQFVFCSNDLGAGWVVFQTDFCVETLRSRQSFWVQWKIFFFKSCICTSKNTNCRNSRPDRTNWLFMHVSLTPNWVESGEISLLVAHCNRLLSGDMLIFSYGCVPLRFGTPGCLSLLYIPHHLDSAAVQCWVLRGKEINDDILYEGCTFIDLVFSWYNLHFLP